MWQFYADPDNVTVGFEDQKRMRPPSRDQLSKTILLFTSCVEGGMVRRHLRGTAQ